MTPKRPPGRPPGRKATATISARLTPERAAKYRKLGGVRWLNAMLDAAKLPPLM